MIDTNKIVVTDINFNRIHPFWLIPKECLIFLLSLTFQNQTKH